MKNKSTFAQLLIMEAAEQKEAQPILGVAKDRKQ